MIIVIHYNTDIVSSLSFHTKKIVLDKKTAKAIIHTKHNNMLGEYWRVQKELSLTKGSLNRCKFKVYSL